MNFKVILYLQRGIESVKYNEKDTMMYAKINYVKVKSYPGSREIVFI